MSEKKNIYAKLQEARVRLAELGIKKGGKNNFSGFTYYELADFLPPLQKILLEVGLTPVVSFESEKATLTLCDVDDPKTQIVFESPMKDANLKGNHEIQNLGAVETYQRRYLYMAAFEIVEADVLDLTHDKKANPGAASEKQVAELVKLIASTNTNIKKLRDHYKIESIADITVEQYKDAKKALQKKLDAMPLEVVDVTDISIGGVDIPGISEEVEI